MIFFNLNHQNKEFRFNGNKFEEVIYPTTVQSDSLFQNKNIGLAHQDKNKNHWIWAVDKTTTQTDLVFFNAKTKQTSKVVFPPSIFPRQDSIFYMYSDGFQDQFGGLAGRKYMSRRFQNYLKTISLLPIKKQKKELAQEFKEWKDSGNEIQIDDVLVIGFRV